MHGRRQRSLHVRRARQHGGSPYRPLTTRGRSRARAAPDRSVPLAHASCASRVPVPWRGGTRPLLTGASPARTLSPLGCARLRATRATAGHDCDKKRERRVAAPAGTQRAAWFRCARPMADARIARRQRASDHGVASCANYVTSRAAAVMRSRTRGRRTDTSPGLGDAGTTWVRLPAR